MLASRNDDVLKIAFSIGDPFADLVHDDHTPFRTALGYEGPPAPVPPPVHFPWQIADSEGYGHFDYLPPAQATLPPAPGTKWSQATEFMKRAFHARPQPWPTL
jgi:hypothetical protein